MRRRVFVHATVAANAVALSIMLACAFGMLAAFPEAAHATFADSTDSYPAAQDLGTLDPVIDGSLLPDGSYEVGARTTSRMCIMYTNPEDAEARDSKERAIISVSGGSITAVFYISKAYNYLYLGTDTEAAAQTDAEGTDASAYIAGDPDEGYVPHLYSIPIPALNSPFTVATFSGGDKGNENGKWYTRQFVFTMTEAELQAIIAESEGGSQISDEDNQNLSSGGDNAGKDGGDEGGDTSSGEEGGNSKDEDNKDEDDDDDEDDDEDDDGDPEKQQPTLNEENVVASGPDSGEQSENVQDGRGKSKKKGKKSSGAQAAAGNRGVLMNITSPYVVAAPPNGTDITTVEVERPLLTPEQILAIVLMGALLVGAGARVVAFWHGYERSDSSSDERPQ